MPPAEETPQKGTVVLKPGKLAPLCLVLALSCITQLSGCAHSKINKSDADKVFALREEQIIALCDEVTEDARDLLYPEQSWPSNEIYKNLVAKNIAVIDKVYSLSLDFPSDVQESSTAGFRTQRTQSASLLMIHGARYTRTTDIVRSSNYLYAAAQYLYLVKPRVSDRTTRNYRFWNGVFLELVETAFSLLQDQRLDDTARSQVQMALDLIDSNGGVEFVRDTTHKHRQWEWRHALEDPDERELYQSYYADRVVLGLKPLEVYIQVKLDLDELFNRMLDPGMEELLEKEAEQMIEDINTKYPELAGDVEPALNTYTIIHDCMDYYNGCKELLAKWH